MPNDRVKLSDVLYKGHYTQHLFEEFGSLFSKVFCDTLQVEPQDK